MAQLGYRVVQERQFLVTVSKKVRAGQVHTLLTSVAVLRQVRQVPAAEHVLHTGMQARQLETLM